MSPNVVKPHTLSLSLPPTRPPKSPLRLKHSTSTPSLSPTGVEQIRKALRDFRFAEDENRERGHSTLVAIIEDDRATRQLPRIHYRSQSLPNVAVPELKTIPSGKSTSKMQATRPGDTSDVGPPHAHPLAPSLRITKPSLPPDTIPPPIRPMHPFAAVVAMMDEGDSPTRRKGKERIEGFAEERQRSRRNMVGPGGIIGRIASRDSLSRFASKAQGLFNPGPQLRPAPPVPNTGSPTRYAPSTSRQPSPSPRQGVMETDVVEIPRFKKRELNLGIVARRGPWRAAWIGLWALWIINGLLSLFFDVNIMFILLQCVLHPAFDSSNNWAFATAAYAICIAISTLVVWLGWEVVYEWWRKWRLPRPAIEPIYLSLPATVHLCLGSYHHFVFLAHIRLSPLGTPYAEDLIPEACQALVQLAPGLVPLLPRAAIAIVLLLSFSNPRRDLQTPFGATDRAQFRDDHFFRHDSPRQLTNYARGVLFAFVACVALRLAVVILSAIGLWICSSHTEKVIRPTSSAARDPSTTTSPQKSWMSAENEFDWAWRDRTRARIQDAFELCMIRRDQPSFANLSMPWGRSATSLNATPRAMSAGEFLSTFVGRSSVSLEPPRPESGVMPKRSDLTNKHPPVAHGIAAFTNTSDSSRDVFYTPRATPVSHVSAVTEFGAKRRSFESEDSVTDDSAALLSTDESRPSRDGSSDSHVSSRNSSVRRRAVSAAATTGKVISRARSTSVSLLRESLSNGLVKRARSGTVLSADSQYSKVDDDLEELAPAAVPRRRSKLGLGLGHPMESSDVRSSTA